MQAKIGHNFVRTMRRIKQEEKRLSKPRSGTQIVNEALPLKARSRGWVKFSTSRLARKRLPAVADG